MADEAHVEVDVIIPPEEPAPDTSLAQIATAVGRVEGALTSISDRLSTVETRSEEAWNNLQVNRDQTALLASQAEEANRIAVEAQAEAEALLAVEADPASEVLNLDVAPEEPTESPQEPPKRPRATVWDHL